MRKVDMNSDRSLETQARIEKIMDDYDNRKVANLYLQSIKEDMEWLLAEMEDYLSGELDESYTDYVNDCILIYNRALRDVRDTATTLKDNINGLDD